MGLSGKSYVRWQKLDPVTLGLNAQSIATAVTSNSFSIAGYNQLAIYTTVGWLSATDCTIKIFTSHDNTTFVQNQASVIASGVETMTNHSIVKTTGVALSWRYITPIMGGEYARLQFSDTGATAGATDTVTVTAYLGVSV